MYQQTRVIVNVNAEIINLINVILNLFIFSDGIVFGGCVRDMLLRESTHAEGGPTNKSLKELSEESEYSIHGSRCIYWEEEDKYIIPSDIDCAFDNEESVNAFIEKLKQAVPGCKLQTEKDVKSKYSTLDHFKLTQVKVVNCLVTSIAIKLDILYVDKQYTETHSKYGIFQAGLSGNCDFDVNALYFDEGGLNLGLFIPRSDKKTFNRGYCHDLPNILLSKSMGPLRLIRLLDTITGYIEKKECHIIRASIQDKTTLKKHRINMIMRTFKMLSKGWKVYAFSEDGSYCCYDTRKECGIEIGDDMEYIKKQEASCCISGEMCAAERKCYRYVICQFCQKVVGDVWCVKKWCSEGIFGGVKCPLCNSEWTLF